MNCFFQFGYKFGRKSQLKFLRLLSDSVRQNVSITTSNTLDVDEFLFRPLTWSNGENAIEKSYIQNSHKVCTVSWSLKMHVFSSIVFLNEII